MKTIKLIFVFGLIAIVGWSCSNSTSVNKNNWNPTYQPYAAAKKVAPADSAIGLAHQIPGFGGMFITRKTEQLAVYLTHPDRQKATAKRVLSNSEFIEKALSNTSASVANMAVKKGGYTFIELYDWEKQISSKILPTIDGGYSIGIDQSRNKVYIGVESKAARDRIHKKLSQLNIPGRSIIIHKISMNYPIGH